ncbi:ester cyclase [Sphingomonas morindae]|uniref:Ester cyclase n=1 Tax=Sphingomonas morindae TaxID=1541170 RepID=A0ABY4XD86_9SPHN|nr:ester cyclase [Sphingomonas morindae]USI74934.1 ester cyclase [Sphingomonas morindae]
MDRLAANKAVVRRFNTAVIEQGDRAAFEALVDPGFHNRTAPPGAPADREALWASFATLLRPALGPLAVTVHAQIAEGDLVVTRKTIRGTHRGALLGHAATGAAVTIEVIDIVRLAEGRYIEHWGLNSLATALAGLAAATTGAGAASTLSPPARR